MKKGRSVYCVFCDDIRHEVGNKFSLMGVYSGGLIVSAASLPTRLPKLAIYIWITSPLSKPFGQVTGSVISPSGAEVARLEAQGDGPAFDKIDKAEGISKYVLSIMTIISPVEITTEGFFEVWIEIEGERERAGRLSVKFQALPSVDTPTVLPPPT
jgi:hypothetical protein